MAKRKRLTPKEFIPAQSDPVDTEMPVLETKGLGVARTFTRPPIAQIAGEAAAASALQELADEVKQAKDDGRMIVKLPLDQVEVGYLVRDRMMADEDELQVLMTSLRARGQQTPIEVVDLGQGRYGLISGWRRLTALTRLAKDTGDERFGHVQALIRTPESAEDAYTAMVEENEIRVGLSYYERARIAAIAVEQGVFETEKAALQELFHAASRPKRSKIGAFLKLYQALDADLSFPTALSERLGIALVKAMDDRPGFAESLQVALRNAAPDTPQAEVALLENLLAKRDQIEPKSPVLETVSAPEPEAQPDPQADTQTPLPDGLGIEMEFDGSVVTLSGPGLTAPLRRRLAEWLKTAPR